MQRAACIRDSGVDVAAIESTLLAAPDSRMMDYDAFLAYTAAKNSASLATRHVYGTSPTFRKLRWQGFRHQQVCAASAMLLYGCLLPPRACVGACVRAMRGGERATTAWRVLSAVFVCRSAMRVS